jgi:hypothetical protein
LRDTGRLVIPTYIATMATYICYEDDKIPCGTCKHLIMSPSFLSTLSFAEVLGIIKDISLPEMEFAITIDLVRTRVYCNGTINWKYKAASHPNKLRIYTDVSTEIYNNWLLAVNLDDDIRALLDSRMYIIYHVTKLSCLQDIIYLMHKYHSRHVDNF